MSVEHPILHAVWVAVALGSAGCGGPSPTVADGGADAAPLRDGGVGIDASDAAPVVPRYAIDLSGTSVSGLSSGGFMAVQFHVAFSSIMKGAAIFAGGPYMCSQGSVSKALTTCAQGSPAPDVQTLVGLTNQNAAAGSIDDPSGLAAQNVFLFSGADDTVVNPSVMDALGSYYAAFVTSGSIQYVSRRPATSHTWPTLDYGSGCDTVATPYLGKCAYDGAGQALAQIYGPLAPRAAAPAGAIVPIPQGAFIADPTSHSLDDTAYAYVPPSCSAGETCRVHVSFHGCLQGASAVGDAFYAHSGLNEWADANHLIVLYPQAVMSSGNPEGCWDFWGYDGPDFAKKTGAQMAMVRAMLDGMKK